MRAQCRPAARPLLVFAAAWLAATATSPAQAQSSDPFALPATATLESVRSADAGTMVAELEIDGRVRSRMVELTGRGQDVTIDAADARAAGLPVSQTATGAVRLDTLKVYSWKFDSFRQRLTIVRFRDNEGGNLRDLATYRYEASESRPLTALRLDYDLSSTVSRKGASIGGLFDAALVRGNLAFSTTARAQANSAGTARFQRLDTRLDYVWERKGLVASAGDIVSAGSQSQRPVRMGGVQIATDAGLRPDLVSMPLPAFTGRVAVPTTIDLVAAGRRQSVGKVEPGDFTIRNVQAPLGRGEVSAILNDALGRETVQTVRFYLSRDLLAKGRSAYAANFGFVRRRFGETGSAYGPAAASAYYRRGLSSDLTLETSAEWTPGLVNVGARADLVIAKLAKATLEGRYSHDVTAGSGKLLDVGIESISDGFGISAGATLPSATYRDVASRLGDPQAPTRFFANAYWRPFGNARFQAGVVRTHERANAAIGRSARRIDSAIAAVQLPVSDRIRFVGTADYRRFDGVSERAVSGGLSIALGQRKRAAVQGRYGNARSGAQISYAQSDSDRSPVAYSLSAGVEDGAGRVDGQMNWRAPMMQVSGQFEWTGATPAARVNARGSLLMVGGQVHARNITQNGFALVKAGTVEGVPITLENRFVGKTDAKGRLLVDRISPTTSVRIDVDDKQLPADALVRETRHVVRVPQRAVVLVELDAIHFRPVMRTIVDGRGMPIEAGTPVVAEPSGERTLSGFDGMVEINAGAEDARLVVGRPGSTCVVELAGIALADDAMGPLRCEPRVIAQGGSTGERPGKAAKGAKTPATRRAAARLPGSASALADR